MATKSGCSTPKPTPEEELAAAKERLLRIAISGVQELEVPSLGRTQYRSMSEIKQAIGLLSQLGGGQGSVAQVTVIQSVRSGGTTRSEGDEK